MARLFVYSDDVSVRIEIVDTSGEGDYAGECNRCEADVLGDREWGGREDAISVAEVHADHVHGEAAPIKRERKSA